MEFCFWVFCGSVFLAWVSCRGGNFEASLKKKKSVYQSSSSLTLVKLARKMAG